LLARGSWAPIGGVGGGSTRLVKQDGLQGLALEGGAPNCHSFGSLGNRDSEWS